MKKFCCGLFLAFAMSETAFAQSTNPFAPGYIQNTNTFGSGYVRDKNPFGSGYVQDKCVLSVC